MILSNALLVIETILFLVSGRLHGDESLSQRFSYYIGGWVGLIYFSWLLMASFMGYDINIIITLIVMAIVFFFLLIGQNIILELSMKMQKNIVQKKRAIHLFGIFSRFLKIFALFFVSLRFNCPTHFCRTCPSVLCTLLCRRPNHIFCIIQINAVFVALLQRFFY